MAIYRDIEKIKNGIGEKVSHFLNIVFGFIVSIIMSFFYGWKLTLIVISYLPILCAVKWFVAKVNLNFQQKIAKNQFNYYDVDKKFQVASSTKELNTFARAANVVEEVLSGVRTVFAFGGEKIEVERYKKHLQPAIKIGIKKGIFACIDDAFVRLLYFASCAVSFWFGAQWVLEDRDKDINDKTYTTATLITVIKRI